MLSGDISYFFALIAGFIAIAEVGMFAFVTASRQAKRK